LNCFSSGRKKKKKKKKRNEQSWAKSSPEGPIPGGKRARPRPRWQTYKEAPAVLTIMSRVHYTIAMSHRQFQKSLCASIPLHAEILDGEWRRAELRRARVSAKLLKDWRPTLVETEFKS
jgi:hypothetical protein